MLSVADRAGYLKGLMFKLITAADVPSRDITIEEATHLSTPETYSNG